MPDKKPSIAEGQKNDQPQSSSDTAGVEYFEQFSTLPAGLHKYVSNDLIGTPLEDIDPFYKDKQVTKAGQILNDTLISCLFIQWQLVTGFTILMLLV